MDRLKEKIKAVPRYGWICGILYFCLQYGMYRLADWITRLTGMIDRAFCPKIRAPKTFLPFRTVVSTETEADATSALMIPHL